MAYQISEYRRQQQERFRGATGYIKEDDDFALALKLQEEEEEEAKIKQDEELARRLQQELDGEPGGATHLPHGPSNNQEDDELAKRIQMEELEMASREALLARMQPNWGQTIPSPTAPTIIVQNIGEGDQLVRIPRLMDALLDRAIRRQTLDPFEQSVDQLNSPLRNLLIRRRRRNMERETGLMFVPFGSTDIFSQEEPSLFADIPLEGFGTDDYESLLGLSETIGTVNRGASRESLEALPIRKYKRAEASEGNKTCGICLADYEEGEEVRTLKCLHCFHKECCDKWLQINKKCPVCREDTD